MKRGERSPVVLVNRCIIENDDNKILLIRRSTHEKKNTGMWEFPGGKLDVGEDISQSTVREVFEETGLIVETEPQPIHAESYIIRDGKYKGLAHAILFWMAHRVGGDLKLSNEHDQHVMESCDIALEKYALTPETRKALMKLGEIALKNTKRDS